MADAAVLRSAVYTPSSGLPDKGPEMFLPQPEKAFSPGSFSSSRGERFNAFYAIL